MGLALDNLQVIIRTSNILIHTNLSISNKPLKCLFFSFKSKKFLRDKEIGHVKHVTHRIVFNNNFETVNFGKLLSLDEVPSPVLFAKFSLLHLQLGPVYHKH